MKMLSKFKPVMVICGVITTPAFAASFLNGGFEAGSFTDWTKGGGTWEESPQNSGNIVITSTVDPDKSASSYDVLNGTGGATVFDSNTSGNLV